MKYPIKILLTAIVILLATEFSSFSQSNENQTIKVHNKLTQKEIDEGWKLLFDGKEIKDWRYYDSASREIKGWTVSNGLLHKPLGIKAGNIMTNKAYHNYIFSWEWKLEDKGNNGVKYFITEERKSAVGHEYQMIDDKKVKDPYSSNGSFYLIVKPVDEKPNLPMGSWNHSKIAVKGNDVEHWLNGMKILSYVCGSNEVMERVPKTKFKKVWKFGEKIKGHILLTDHNDACWYRNIKIKELP